MFAPMPNLARLLVVTVLAVFAAGTIHAAGATTMVVKMTLADAGMDVSAWESCDDGEAGGDGPICDSDCVVPCPATLGRETGDFGPRVSLRHEVRRLRGFAGRAARPDPYPPRTFV